MASAMLGRAPGNPLLTPGDVTPSRPDFEVIGVFNRASLGPRQRP